MSHTDEADEIAQSLFWHLPFSCVLSQAIIENVAMIELAVRQGTRSKRKSSWTKSWRQFYCKWCHHQVNQQYKKRPLRMPEADVFTECWKTILKTHLRFCRNCCIILWWCFFLQCLSEHVCPRQLCHPMVWTFQKVDLWNSRKVYYVHRFKIRVYCNDLKYSFLQFSLFDLNKNL